MPFMKDYPVMSGEIRVSSKLDSLKDCNAGYNGVFIHLKNTFSSLQKVSCLNPIIKNKTKQWTSGRKPESCTSYLMSKKWWKTILTDTDMGLWATCWTQGGMCPFSKPFIRQGQVGCGPRMWAIVGSHEKNPSYVLGIVPRFCSAQKALCGCNVKAPAHRQTPKRTP